MVRHFLSPKVKAAAKRFDTPLYLVARNCGILPGAAYRGVAGVSPVRPDDERFLRLVAVLGVPPEEAFEEHTFPVESNG